MSVALSPLKIRSISPPCGDATHGPRVHEGERGKLSYFNNDAPENEVIRVSVYSLVSFFSPPLIPFSMPPRGKCRQRTWTERNPRMAYYLLMMDLPSSQPPHLPFLDSHKTWLSHVLCESGQESILGGETGPGSSGGGTWGVRMKKGSSCGTGRSLQMPAWRWFWSASGS